MSTEWRSACIKFRLNKLEAKLRSGGNVKWLYSEKCPFSKKLTRRRLRISLYNSNVDDERIKLSYRVKKSKCSDGDSSSDSLSEEDFQEPTEKAEVREAPMKKVAEKEIINAAKLAFNEHIENVSEADSEENNQLLGNFSDEQYKFPRSSELDSKSMFWAFHFQVLPLL